MIIMMTKGKGMKEKNNFPGLLPGSLERIRENKKARVKRKTTLIPILMILFAELIVILPSSSHVGAQNIEQRVESAIVLGDELPYLIGIAIDEIWVYTYVAGDWKQIPFQIDERNDINGSYFFDAIDGVLDSNDEIVFMPFDAGDVALATNWVLNTKELRYEVTVTDPIDFTMKYVYIYDSSSLTKTFTEDYADYDPISHVIWATDYTLGFDDTYIGVMDEMRINASAGGDDTDILDRNKYRLQKTVGLLHPQCFEEDFDYELIGYKDGPVRVILEVTSQNETDDFFVNINTTMYAYKSYSQVIQTLNTNTSTDWLRVSMDFLSTSTPMTYYDSGSNDLTIDGTPDTPTDTYAPTWNEVTGSHGTVITIGNFSEFGGTQSLYYNDDLNSNDEPESEFGEYGDYGINLTDSPGGSHFTNLSYYFLPPNQENVGFVYANYTNNPLTMTVLSQYADPTPPPEVRDVRAIPDLQEAVGYVNISAVIEDNLDQLYGAWINITDPNGGNEGNFSMLFDSNTDRYYDNRTYGVVGTHQFIIWTNDTSSNWNSSIGQFVIQDNTPPIAYAGLDKAVTEDTIVVFDGSGSTDNGDIVNYVWTFTDVTLQTMLGINPIYTFNNIGNFEITLNVSDTAGNWDTDTMWVNVSEIIMTGSISGMVMDANGNPIEGATVTLVGTPYEATTNETGYYMISDITEGIYDIKVTKNGFETGTMANVRILAGQDRLNGNFELKKVTEKGGDNFLWIILIIGIILVIILVVFLFLPKLKKEKEGVDAISLKELKKEPAELVVAEDKVEEEEPKGTLWAAEAVKRTSTIEAYRGADELLEGVELEEKVVEEEPKEALWEAVEQTSLIEAYRGADELLEGIKPEEGKLDTDTLSSEDRRGLRPEVLDIDKELDKLFTEESKLQPVKKDLKEELEALSNEIDRILSGSEEEETEGED